MAANGITSTADITSVLPTIISPARDFMEKPTFMEKMISHVPLKDGDGSTYNWPKFTSQFTAQSLSEGSPINNPQKLAAASQQFTTSEVGLEVILTDKAQRQTPEAMKARAGRYAGAAMKRKKEQDILGLFAGFSRDLGSAGAAFAPGWLSVANVRLGSAAETNQDEIAPRPYSAVIHPFHYHDVLVSGASLGSNINSTSGYFPIQGLTEELIRNYDVQVLYDIAMAKNPQISIDGSDDAVGAVFSKEALLHITTSVSMKVEYDRDIHLRAWDMVITSEYGVGEVEDEWGFKITADATAPTS